MPTATQRWGGSTPRPTAKPLSTAHLGDLARHVHELSLQEWGERRATTLVGRHEKLEEALQRVVRYAAAESPVLITGETGTGKELFARALFLTSRRNRKAFLSVNCAQYCGMELVASELFGHRKGSFTGAVTEHRGVFEEADGGFVLLDEIGDLPLPAQAMLLRTLSEGEVVPVGGTHAKRVAVRIVTATSRDLQPMVAAGTFRADLYYRLRQLHVNVPPLRERGNDWELVTEHYLDTLVSQCQSPKRFSPEAMKILRNHSWPGNVREVRSLVDTGFHMSMGEVITPADFGDALVVAAREQQHATSQAGVEYCTRMIMGGATFWEAVHRPYMERDLNRSEVRDIIANGLDLSRGSYKRMLDVFGIAQHDYLKFMDFLRHHKLKPEG
jgi:DNA-binding NtrC family response regulator